MEPKILKRLERIVDLPTLPVIIQRLEKAISDPNSDAKTLVKIIEDDPSIMTRVLKVVNSVFYAPAYGQKISDLLPAVTRLGFNTIKNITMTTAVFDSFASPKTPLFDREAFWRHSVSVGIVAVVLYDFCSNAIAYRVPKDVIHLFGILHDLGKIVMEMYFTEEFHRSINLAREKSIPLYQAEQEVLATDHAEIGAWLCERWNITPDIVNIVRCHHDPLLIDDGKCKSMAMITHMADYICLVQGLGASANPVPTYNEEVRKGLGIEMQQIGELMDVVQEESEKSEILLSLK